MMRVSLYSVAVLTLFTVGQAGADDTKSKDDGNKHKATISNFDSKKGTVDLKMKDGDGKRVDKTLQLADKVDYLDSNGKATDSAAFHQGDRVLVTEKDGKVAELRKARLQARITNVDASKGTVTVKMPDANGKDIEKTFQLAEDVEYIDSTGKVIELDEFRSGDDVLFIEAEGRIKEMKKHANHKATPSKNATSKLQK